jgi:hypothetical protein
MSMDKYAVELDQEKLAKIEKEKIAAGKTPSSTDHPNSNIPLDPKLGSLPFEKEPPNGR